MTSDSAPLFNFLDFLTKRDPGQQYTVKPLSGGLVNLTSRATKISPSTEDSFGRRKSLILKHATPFIASLGPDFPFGIERQITEAAALSLFKQNDGPISHLPSVCNVRVPELLDHDSDLNVIVISDLGDWNDLSAILTPIKNASSSKFPSLTQRNASSIGRRLGNFFAKLHSEDVASLVSSTSFPLPKNFKPRGDYEPESSGAPLANDTSSVVYEVAVKPVHGYLRDYGVCFDDAQDLYSRVDRAFAINSLGPSEGRDFRQKMFTLGDAWTGAILLGPQPSVGFESDVEVAVIDWEFAALKKGHGVDTDIAQLIAGMHLHWIQANASGDSKLSKFIRCMMETFLQAYGTNRAEAGAWDKGLDGEERTQKKFNMIRASFILFGRELINNAIEREWTCSCCGENDGAKVLDHEPLIQHKGAVERCRLRIEMVETGIWYLRIAAEDDDKFEKCWEETRDKETIFRNVFDYERDGLWCS